MKKLINKNKLNRRLFQKTEILNYTLRSILKNKLIKTTIAWNVSHSLSKHFNKNSITLLNNCCIFTGKSVSLNIKFKISRMTFLKFSRLSYVHGLKKICW